MVRFRPPLWQVEVAALIAAGVIVAAGTVVTAIHRLRTRRGEAAPADLS